MNYRRALFLMNDAREPGAALSALRRVAPKLERLLIVVPVPERPFARPASRAVSRDAVDDPGDDALRAAAKGVAPRVDVQRAPALGGAALAEFCAAEDVDLLVFATRSLRSATAVSAQRGRAPVAVLWAEGEAAQGPIRRIGCLVTDEGSREAVEAFLRDHTDASMHTTILMPRSVAPDVLSTARSVSGIAARVEVSSPLDAPSMRRWFDEWAHARPLDLLVFARLPTAFVLGALRTAPTLLVPPVRSPKAVSRRPLDVADLLDDGGPLRLRVDQVVTAGYLVPVPDQALAFVAEGRVVATVDARDGEVELPANSAADSLGVYRVEATEGADPLAAVEARVQVVRCARRPLVLFDAERPALMLRALSRLTAPVDPDVLAVRLRPTQRCEALRERLRALGLSPTVVDARAVLDEGEALDVSETLDPVRLARVASRLRRAGFPVVAIVHRGDVSPRGEGFAALGPEDLTGEVDALRGVVAPAWDALIPGNRIDLEADNATARRWLLEAIHGSVESLHLQVYMAADDDVGAPVGEALAAAGARGVTVRVLVDSLHGLHGSFGVENPLLARLSACPGVAVRVGRPIAEVPSLADLKQRDHRKLVVADGRVALLGGRNLSHEYYTGFDEVAITPASLWRELPWLDVGARVEGPAVGALARSFRDAWREAGGEGFEVDDPSVAGSSSARVIVHRGLRDARALDTYRALIEAARSHVVVVNGFPLILELQHALLRALRRGVRVRAMVGHTSPTHEGEPFEGPWQSARAVANELVHSRMDPLVAAGGEVFLFAQRDVPGWAPALGVVHPHVHAKALSVDGLRCTVGSANLDITASYWESELLLVVEDAALARRFEARFDALMKASTRVEPEDPGWQQSARRRGWMRHWPGVLSA